MNRRNSYFYGVLAGGLSVMFSLIQFWCNFLYNPTNFTRFFFGVFPILWLFLCIFLGIFELQKNKETISISSMLKKGLGISLVSALIVSIFHYFFITEIAPDFLQKSTDLQLQELEKHRESFPKEKYEQLLSNIKKNATPFIQFTTSIIANLFVGFFASLSFSVLFKLVKSRPKN